MCRFSVYYIYVELYIYTLRHQLSPNQVLFPSNSARVNFFFFTFRLFSLLRRTNTPVCKTFTTSYRQSTGVPNLPTTFPLYLRSGHAKGSAGTLPRYVPVADVGSGRLHQKPTASSVSPEDNAEPKRGKKRGENVRRGNNRTEESASQQVGRLDSTEASETKKVVDHGDQNEQSPIFQSGEGRNTGEKGRELPAPLHRGSAGSLDDRRNQAEQALWGGRRVPTETHADNNNNNNRPVHASATGGGGAWNGGDDWWETGTQYAFQPRLVADKPTVRSLAGHYSGGGAAGRQVRKGGGGGGGRNEGSESKLPVRRVIQPAVGNSDRGQRVFFLA